ILFLLLLLRFGAILFVYSSEYFYNTMLEENFINSTKIIEKTKSELNDIKRRNSTIIEVKEDAGFFSNVSSKYDKVVQNLDISKQLQLLEKNIEDASRNIINLITIFFVLTILMPIIFLWLLIGTIKLLFKFEIDNKKIIFMLN
ncbi:MAG: hypothetical protein U9N02_09180, partial [Campylobacterota bacterium]|nr:hypothetical protein [Campylobacterota bacterium]